MIGGRRHRGRCGAHARRHAVHEGMLYGVSAADPVTSASVAALPAGVALAAGLIPRGATKVGPMVVLRYD